MPVNSFTVLASDLRTVRRIDDGAAAGPLSDGDIRLRVGPFALTSNNVTYGVLGQAMGYFAFFPAGGEGEGRIPVWGFADVVESTLPEVTVGERFYGYYPPSSHAILRPSRVTASGFLESGEHRRNLPRIYNQYVGTKNDPGYSRELEGEIAVFRPLFATAFLLDDFLAEESFFEAQTVVLSSASSKTAYATAFFLARRRARGGPSPKVVGLTSKRSAAFVSRLGCYDQVVHYDDVESLPREPSVYVDFSGDAPVKARVHRHLGDALRHSAIVGSTHWSARGEGEALPGPEPTLFFAPSQAEKRVADLGPEGLQEGIAGGWAEFSRRAFGAPAPWVRIVRESGLDRAIATYTELLDGTVAAEEGRVVTI